MKPKAVAWEKLSDEEFARLYNKSLPVKARAKRRLQGTNVVLLDPDVAAVFWSSQSVNQALRLLIDRAKRQAG